MKLIEVKDFLEEKVEHYNQSTFIEDDPVQIVHQFNKKEDIEIIGFLTATIAWGNRKSIIKNAQRIVDIMGGEPHLFILSYEEQELDFVHRTFNSIDLNFFFKSLKNIYQNHKGLESVFPTSMTAKERIIHFRNIFLEVEHEKVN